jgi:hypothetical protein
MAMANSEPRGSISDRIMVVYGAGYFDDKFRGMQQDRRLPNSEIVDNTFPEKHGLRRLLEALGSKSTSTPTRHTLAVPLSSFLAFYKRILKKIPDPVFAELKNKTVWKNEPPLVQLVYP